MQTARALVTTTKMNSQCTIQLGDGRRMPLFGLGTWRCVDGDNTRSVINWALEHGYRLIDTAARYGNEESVGAAIRSSGIPREDLFVVTKVWNDAHGAELTRRAFHESLSKLGLDYIDLYLIHSPIGGKLVETWRTFVELQVAGLIRSIGVSNFNTFHLEEFKNAGLPQPAVNQIELHPWLQQRSVVDYCRQHGIAVMGYCPLARFRKSGAPEVVALAEKHKKTESQVLLRWAIQQQFITIPKSGREAGIKENAEIFDFELSREDMAMIGSLDCGFRVCPDAINTPWTD